MSEKREIMMDTETILENLFFGPAPAFKALMDENIKPFFTDREEQMRVLLGVFASKEYTRMVELDQYREKYLDSLLTPQTGELAH